MMHTHSLPLPLRRQITLALLATVLLLGLAILSSYHHQARSAGVASNPWIDAPSSQQLVIVGGSPAPEGQFPNG